MYVNDAGGGVPVMPDLHRFELAAMAAAAARRHAQAPDADPTGAHRDVGRKLSDKGPRFLNDPKWQFKQNALQTITSTPDHPLSFLVEDGPNGVPQLKRPPSRAHSNLIGNETDPAPDYVEAGHRTTRASGEPEFLGVQDAHDNQREGLEERRGVIYDRSFVDIGDVPVEKRTALRWEGETDPATGAPKLAPGTTAAARPTPGARVVDPLATASGPADTSPSRALRGLDGFTADARLTGPARAGSLFARGTAALPGVLEHAGKVAGPLAAVGAGLELGDAYEADGGRIGSHTEAAASGVAGAWIGAELGAETGAEAGAAIGALFGGVGAAPGAAIGGVVGGVVGGIAGSSLGHAIAHLF
jgi:hypothetical protein